MVGLTYLSSRLHRFASLVAETGGNGGASIEVHYKDKVYLLSLVPTGEKYVYKTQNNSAPRKPGIKLQTSDCPKCGGIRVGGHCISAKCDTSRPQTSFIPK